MSNNDVPERDQALRLMRSHAYFHGLADELLEEVAAHVRVSRYETGDIIYQADQPVTHIGFLVSGRLKGTIRNAEGVEQLFRFAERGEAIGLISAAMTDPLPLTALAVEPSTLLMLNYQTAMDLTARLPELRSHWNQKIAGALRSQIVGDSQKLETLILVVFHHSDASRDLTPKLVQRLRDAGESIGVFTDGTSTSFGADVPVRSLIEEGKCLTEGEVHQQIGDWGKPGRLVADLGAYVDTKIASQVIGLGHRVLYVCDEHNHHQAVKRLHDLEANSPAIRDKVTLVWLLSGQVATPPAPEVTKVASSDLKLSASDVATPYGAAVSRGFDRLVHHIRGIRIGLALGGGAARGMAHLGVLRALERHGIGIDRIAGTSAGAMTGVLYSAGFDPDYIVQRFAEDLQPSWLFRHLPRGGYWYLSYKYRRGQFDPMLRKYLQDLRLEQLPIPASAISVDLVSGRAVIRDTGDAVHSILDSINLPLLSRPILRDGQALIDGGFVNNVPADVLVSQGCNLVIAVDVMATIEQEFAGLKPETPASRGKLPNSMQTILRTYAVQSFNMNSIGMQPADVRIEPNTCTFGMSAFTEAAALADIGEEAAKKQLPCIETLLQRLGDSRTPTKVVADGCR